MSSRYPPFQQPVSSTTFPPIAGQALQPSHTSSSYGTLVEEAPREPNPQTKKTKLSSNPSGKKWDCRYNSFEMTCFYITTAHITSPL